MTWDPLTTPNFTRAEMACKCGNCNGACDMNADFMHRLQALRNRVGPLAITSAYRCPDHPVEAVKHRPGSHSAGLAADIRWPKGSAKAHELLTAAMAMGFEGVGLHNSFLHLDTGHPRMPRPASWRYP